MKVKEIFLDFSLGFIWSAEKVCGVATRSSHTRKSKWEEKLGKYKIENFLILSADVERYLYSCLLVISSKISSVMSSDISSLISVVISSDVS